MNKRCFFKSLYCIFAAVAIICLIIYWVFRQKWALKIDAVFILISLFIAITRDVILARLKK